MGLITPIGSLLDQQTRRQTPSLFWCNHSLIRKESTGCPMDHLNDTQTIIAIHRLLHRLKNALEEKTETITDIQQIKIRTVNSAL
jgi:hypothetical protein